MFREGIIQRSRIIGQPWRNLIGERCILCAEPADKVVLGPIESGAGTDVPARDACAPPLGAQSVEWSASCLSSNPPKSSSRVKTATTYA
jgi:hypothetical protein